MLVNTSPTTDPEETSIENDGFFPDIVLADMREAQRIDGTVPSLRLRSLAINAIISVNRQLSQFKANQLSLGMETLEDVPATEVDGKSVNVHHYLHAVGCLVKAELIERYRDFDTTEAGRQTADELTPNIDELRRDSRWSISDLQGLPRSVVELI